MVLQHVYMSKHVAEYVICAKAGSHVLVAKRDSYVINLVIKRDPDATQ